MYLLSVFSFSQTEDFKPDSFTSYLLGELPNLKTSKLSNVQTILQSALKHVRPAICPMMNKVRKAFAIIHEPAKVSDHTIKFTAGLTAAVLLVSDIENVSSVENLRILVRYLEYYKLKSFIFRWAPYIMWIPCIIRN